VVDKRKKPLMPCRGKRARLLPEPGRAVVHQRCPFTIRIKDRVGGEAQAVRVNVDPGSKKTGTAPRLDNRRKPEGGLSPSLRHRVDTCMAWVERCGALPGHRNRRRLQTYPPRRRLPLRPPARASSPE
jgi:RRXRR protein